MVVLGFLFLLGDFTACSFLPVGVINCRAMHGLMVIATRAR